jgi:3-hydroxyisobutyrate dehydrogenase-like beta-hydroxyacid dehydrogenase
MASRLVRAGFPTRGFDIAAGARAASAAEGVEVLPSAGDVAAASSVLLLSLPDQQVLERTLAGGVDDGALEVGGRIIIDTTTTTVGVAQRLSALVGSRGGAFLDAPVTGGTLGAESGRLTFMVGGDAGVFERVRPVFEALGTKAVHVGPSGHGQAAKMVNQMLMAAIYTSVAEAFAFAAQLGVNIERVYDSVEGGGAQSRLLSAIRPGLLEGRVRENGNLGQHGKDIDYVMEEACGRRIPLPVTSAVHQFYQTARALGFAGAASGDMWAVWERILGIDLSATVQAKPDGAPGREEGNGSCGT